MFIHDVNQLGYKIKYIQEIKALPDMDIKRIAPIIIKYDMKFLDLMTNNEMILLIGRKCMNLYSDYLLTEFCKPNIYYKENVFNFSRRWALSNTIIAIKDKSKIREYICIIENEKLSKDSIFFIIQLSKWKVDDFIIPLKRLLTNESYEVRVAAVDGLCRYHDIELLDDILSLSNDANQYVRRAVKSAEKKLSKLK
jgi:hypothetical protein